MSSAPTLGVSRFLPGGLARWLDAMPHPNLVCEIEPGRVVVARWPRGRHRIDDCSVEPLPAGSVVPSAVEPNLVNPAAVRRALNRSLAAIDARPQEMALLIPDQAVRVFLLQFDTLPRRSDEVIPLIRWRLKKSVPFDVEETAVSYMLQPAREAGIEVLAALGRQRIIRQYEEVLESAGLAPGVVLGSTLAALSLLDSAGSTLLARLSGSTLTTVVVRGTVVCVYRCTEMGRDIGLLEPRALLEEIFPAVAYFQDTFAANIEHVRLAGFGDRFNEFRGVVQGELSAPVSVLLDPALLADHLSAETRRQSERYLDAVLGWMQNGA